MALTQAQKDAFFAALDAAASDDFQTTVIRAAGDLPLTDVMPALREYAQMLALRQRTEGLVLRAMDAIGAEGRRAGVANPGELMALRGFTTLPQLLASLGFTGDVDALAAELERAVRRAA